MLIQSQPTLTNGLGWAGVQQWREEASGGGKLLVWRGLALPQPPSGVAHEQEIFAVLKTSIQMTLQLSLLNTWGGHTQRMAT